MFIAIFYGIMIIRERDSGVLTRLMDTPTPRSALVTGKAFAAGVKAVIQAVVVVVIAALLGVGMSWNPPHLLGVAVVVVLASAFSSSLSMSIAGIVLTRDRLTGIGQAITMPLLFVCNALCPVALMPGRLQAFSRVNPLSCQVDALRGLLIGTPSQLHLTSGYWPSPPRSASRPPVHCSAGSPADADTPPPCRRASRIPYPVSRTKPRAGRRVRAAPAPHQSPIRRACESIHHRGGHPPRPSAVEDPRPGEPSAFVSPSHLPPTSGNYRYPPIDYARNPRLASEEPD